MKIEDFSANLSIWLFHGTYNASKVSCHPESQFPYPNSQKLPKRRENYHVIEVSQFQCPFFRNSVAKFLWKGKNWEYTTPFGISKTNFVKYYSLKLSQANQD